jgi:hypothetical protein
MLSTRTLKKLDPETAATLQSELPTLFTTDGAVVD